MPKRSKLPSELLAMSSLAVLGVYGVGYLLSAPAAHQVQQASRLAPRPQPSGYRDGTYLGMGRSNFGDVYVVVVVEQRTLRHVYINHVTTTFPASLIATMPAEMVSRQNGHVDLVTGATASSRAFVEAVQAALAQAGT